MRNIKYFFGLAVVFILLTTVMESCSSSKEVINNKSGAMLWSENCTRCHNAPSPSDFNKTQWTTIGLHMQDRANLTNDEMRKIVTFLQSCN